MSRGGSTPGAGGVGRVATERVRGRRAAWITGAGLGAGVGVTATAVGMRRRSRHRESVPGIATVTVLADEDAVRRAWERLGAPAGPVELRPAPGDRGTEVHARVADGNAGDVRAGLRELKSLVECDSVVRAWPAPSGRGPLAESVTRALTGRPRGRGRG
jgi:hypothetical protein